MKTMYLVIKKSNEKIICNTADDVKSINPKEICKVYGMHETNYDDIVSTADIRTCIYNILKGSQLTKEEVLEEAHETLGIKKSEISKVITAMKKEKIIYDVIDMPCIGID